ncbi:MAG: LysR family transcriptional regulator substrate-binding protein, partial [Pseudomonadota bacterium]
TSSMERIGSSAADIGIITAPAHRKDLYTYKITEARYVLHCRADHPLARRESVSLREVCDEVLLLPEKGSLTQRVVAQRLNDYGLRPRRSIKTTTFPVMKEAILQGVGVGIFLDCSATEESRLVEIPILEMPEPYDTCLVIPRHKLDLRLMQSFAHLVRDNSQYREPQPPALRSGFLSTAKAS